MDLSRYMQFLTNGRKRGHELTQSSKLIADLNDLTAKQVMSAIADKVEEQMTESLFDVINNLVSNSGPIGDHTIERIVDQNSIQYTEQRDDPKIDQNNCQSNDQNEPKEEEHNSDDHNSEVQNSENHNTEDLNIKDHNTKDDNNEEHNNEGQNNEKHNNEEHDPNSIATQEAAKESNTESYIESNNESDESDDNMGLNHLPRAKMIDIFRSAADFDSVPDTDDNLNHEEDSDAQNQQFFANEDNKFEDISDDNDVSNRRHEAAIGNNDSVVPQMPDRSVSEEDSSSDESSSSEEVQQNEESDEYRIVTVMVPYLDDIKPPKFKKIPLKLGLNKNKKGLSIHNFNNL